MSPTVSKASRIDSRGETIADPISTLLFGVLEPRSRDIATSFAKTRQDPRNGLSVQLGNPRNSSFLRLELQWFSVEIIFHEEHENTPPFNNESNVTFFMNVIVFENYIYITGELNFLFFFFKKKNDDFQNNYYRGIS